MPDVRFSALWHRTQYCFKNGFTWWSNDPLERRLILRPVHGRGRGREQEGDRQR